MTTTHTDLAAEPRPPAAELGHEDAFAGLGTEPSGYVGSSGLAAACAAGTVALYRERGNGTLRRLPYLAPGSPAREVADWFAMRLEEGATVAVISTEAGVSRITVRRTLAALALTEAIEDGDHDDAYEPGVVALVLGGVDEDGDQ